MPRSVEDLMKLPGVGRYTASAVASIAYAQVTGLVDGNVSRVLSRVTRVGADISSGHVTQHMWSRSEQLVDSARPGDFNQAMMELGAVVCTPKNPQCSQCPVRSQCSAHNNNIAPDIEDCDFCIPKKEFNQSLGVTNYPRKLKKTQSKDQETLVVMVKHHIKNEGEVVYLTERRPSTGLLANLLQFPCIELSAGQELSEEEKTELVEQFLSKKQSFKWSGLKKCCDVKHVFSHINMTYSVYSVDTDKVDLDEKDNLWMDEQQFLKEGTSTAMKKVLKAMTDQSKNRPVLKKKALAPVIDKKQKSLTSFFKVKSEK